MGIFCFPGMAERVFAVAEMSADHGNPGQPSAFLGEHHLDLTEEAFVLDMEEDIIDGDLGYVMAPAEASVAQLRAGHEAKMAGHFPEKFHRLADPAWPRLKFGKNFLFGRGQVIFAEVINEVVCDFLWVLRKRVILGQDDVRSVVPGASMMEDGKKNPLNSRKCTGRKLSVLAALPAEASSGMEKRDQMLLMSVFIRISSDAFSTTSKISPAVLPGSISPGVK
jgi:hypothetical protein